MKKTLISVLLAVLVIFGFSQCSDDPSNPSSNSVLMPLVKGNWWTYSQTKYDSLGNVEKQDYETVKIEFDTLISGVSYYLFGESLVRNTDNGFSVYEVEDDDIYLSLLFKYPASVGEQWAIDNDTMQLVSNNFSVTTPKGTFSCYKYKNWRSYDYGVTTHFYNYFCPGTGLILYEYYRQENGGKMYLSRKMLLNDYYLIK